MDLMKHRVLVKLLLVGLLCVGFPALAAAQSTLDWPTGEFRASELDSGVLANRGLQPEIAYEELVTVKDAAWMRIYFGKVKLEEGSLIRMTSLFDGEVQELDADALAMWNNTSAYFNGDQVYLELLAWPGTARNRVVIDRVSVHIPEVTRGPCADDDCGICGADNRTLSSELWCARIVPVGCTGSIVSTDSCVVSAGHCADGSYDDTLQFNVPASSSSCYTYNPPVADQFPVTAHQFVNGGVGADWAVMTVGTNNLGQTPYERYGEMRPIATALAGSGDPCDNWGYGVDNSDPTRSQVQQTHSGDILSRTSTYYAFDLDMTYGNSGSALLKNDEIIGIITHCSFSCENYATRIDLSAFEAARDSLCGGGGGGYCSANSNSSDYEYIERVQMGTIDNSSGASGYSDYTGQSTDMNIGSGYLTTITLNTTYATDIGGMWIDWNQDEDFDDAGETITTSWIGVGPYTVTVTPPAGATPGATRMRVRIMDGEFDPTPFACGSTSYGEVEDYTITVTSGGGDTTPPTPNPMQWTTVPYATGTTSLSMQCVTATDAASPPVQYRFNSSFNGNSAWQTSRTFSQGGLAVNTSYSYQVQARDSAATPNETGWSSSASAYTLANTPAAPTVNGPTTSTLNVNVNANGNPSGTVFAIQCSATSDSSWLNRFVDAAGNPSASAVWRTDAAWGTVTAQGLTAGVQYCFRVKARNGDNIETSYGSAACATTSSDITDTVSATMACVPDNGVLPFTTTMYVTLENLYSGFTRTISGRININLAGGLAIGGWRAGYTNIPAGGVFNTSWNTSLPALGSLAGTNIFTLLAMDITASPYNQPPYPPAGDTDSSACYIVGTMN